MTGRKIRLHVEELAVESFALADTQAVRGTVHGQATDRNSGCPRTCTDYTDCWGVCGEASQLCGGDTEFTWHVNTCAYYYTCPGYQAENSCNGTCDPYADTCAWDCTA